MYVDIGTHWIALYISNNDDIYFHSFGVEHAPKEIEKFINRSLVTTNIFKTRSYHSIMCGYFCIRFINFMLKSKILTEFTIFFHQITLKK